MREQIGKLAFRTPYSLKYTIPRFSHPSSPY